jgi:hypothetical protein
VKQTDIRFIERQLARLEEDAPPMPEPQEIFANLIRQAQLWTPQEYAYIQHFHKIYGFDEHSDMLRGEIAYDEWMYWHLTAVQRYQMSARELGKHLATLPTSRPLVWRFENSYDPMTESKQRRRKQQACMPWDNAVPYDVASLRARGWHFVALQLTHGIIWQLPAPWPHSIFALSQDDPDVTVLFEGPGSFSELTYYLDHKATICKACKVRKIEQPLDYTNYPPDAGYSYRWEDGRVIPGGYMHGYLLEREARSANRLQLEAGDM